MAFSKKDILADIGLLAVVGVLGFGAYKILRPSLSRISAALHLPVPTLEALPVGTAIAADWSVESLDGKVVPISSLKGKVVFLNFWATWCGPCRREMKSIEDLYSRYKDKGVVFLLISHEDRQEIENFAAKRDRPAPIYRVAKIPESLNVNGLPTSIILDRKGQVAFSYIGAKDWDKKKIHTLLDGLLAQPS